MGTNPINGHVELRPSPACMEAIGEFECGHGVMIISQKEFYVGENPKTYYNKKPWSQLKRESVYVPAVESYAPIANYMINACKKMDCLDQVDRFRVRLDQLKSIGTVLAGVPAIAHP
jgi:hypothetical protein